MNSLRIGFVGAGQMAQALASGFVRSGHVQPQAIVAFDPASRSAAQFLEKVPGATIGKSNRAVRDGSDVIVLAVKPQQMPAVMAELQPVSDADKLVVSIAAGVALSDLRDGLKTSRVIRVMPNTPCLVGAGACCFSLGADARPSDGELVQRLLQTVGLAWQLDERLLDAVTGLSGSGPAFVFLIIEALSDGGVRMGLPRDIATQLTAQTLLGSARLVLESNEHPAVLKERVASPGGTTIAGLHVLEQQAVRGALMSAVEAATRRANELGSR